MENPLLIHKTSNGFSVATESATTNIGCRSVVADFSATDLLVADFSATKISMLTITNG
jgi:hypothetical protein